MSRARFGKSFVLVANDSRKMDPGSREDQGNGFLQITEDILTVTIHAQSSVPPVGWIQNDRARRKLGTCLNLFRRLTDNVDAIPRSGQIVCIERGRLQNDSV